MAFSSRDNLCPVFPFVPLVIVLSYLSGVQRLVLLPTGRLQNGENEAFFSDGRTRIATLSFPVLKCSTLIYFK